VLEDPPYVRAEMAKRKGAQVDYVGLALVALGVGTLQMVLDKGQEEDWFGSRWITAGLIAAIVILIYWVKREWSHEHPIVELKLLKLRNFAMAVLSIFVLGMVLYGTTVLLPIFLQTAMGYPAVVAGEAMAGGGLIMMITMPAAGVLTGKMDPRFLMCAGFGLTSLGLYYVATHLSLTMDFRTAFLMRAVQVAGLGFVFIPSNVLSYVGVPREKSNQVSSIINFVRNIGGSIGIAMVNTFITRGTQRRRSYLAAYATEGNPKFRELVDGLTALLHSQGMSLAQATKQAYERVSMLLEQQAAAGAFIDVLAGLAIVVACLIPLPLLMKKPPVHSDAPPMH
jgi:MFS transporter, DHA2 family, multidrug resistance protein